MTKAFIVLALSIAFSLNSLTLYEMIRILKKYSVKMSSTVDRSLRKAHVSKKKLEIASTQVKRIRGKVFKLTMYQFFMPMLTFLVSIVIYTIITSTLFPYENPLTIRLNRYCIAPIPIQFPENRGCYMQVTWLFFLVFLLYLPLYSYYTKKYLGT
ncbi:MAG: hypothetical protein QXM55_00160 [Ignisphaera sp.]